MAKKTKISSKIIKYLEKAGAKYNILEHKTVYTAFDTASTMRRKLNEIVKSLLVVADKDYYLALLSADNNLDFEKLAKTISKLSNKVVKVIKIPKEKVMESLLKVKAGAMSAFGGMYKLPVIIDKKLAKLKNGIFSSGSFNHSIEMAIKDFVKLEKALLADFSIKKKIKKTLKQENKKTKKQKIIISTRL